MKLHQFTPNGIVALAKFLWVVRSFGGEVSVDAFCRLFQLHCQPRKVYVDDDAELSEVQNGCCTFVPRKPNKRTGLLKVMLSTAYKNKWEGNCLGYWFYAKIGFPDPKVLVRRSICWLRILRCSITSISLPSASAGQVSNRVWRPS